MKWIVLALLLSAGCAPTARRGLDFDGDGTPDDLDCGPEDPLTHPGAVDPWGDEDDQNCDGVDGTDDDEDGFPAAGPGVARERVDCDDADPSVHPGSLEIIDDGIDQDCDGRDWHDTDGDGVRDLFDCAPEDPAMNYRDEDGDLVGTCAGDCDDTRPWVRPGAFERFNGRDDDCDGEVDERVTTGVADGILLGTAGNQELGRYAAVGGDGDGDGRPDLLLGSPLEGDGGAGTIAFFSGATLLDEFVRYVDPSEATVFGTGTDDMLGRGIAWLDDLDGDGRDEFALAARVVEEAQGPGAVLVFSGAALDSAPLTRADALALVEGPTPTSGRSIAIAWMPATSTWPGALVLGFPTAALEGEYQDGAVFLVPGEAISAGGTIPLGPADAVAVGDAPELSLGRSVGALGDVTGDGLPELLFGAPRAPFEPGSDVGCIGMIPSEALEPGAPFTLETLPWGRRGYISDHQFGHELHPLPDLDGDGWPELAVAALAGEGPSGHEAGEVFLIRSPHLRGDGTMQDHPLAWEEGETVTALPDLDGDDLPDLLVAVPLAGVASIEVGGPPFPRADATPLLHPYEHSDLGEFAGVADFDGDGTPDLVIGAPEDDRGLTNAGALYIFSLGDPPTP